MVVGVERGSVEGWKWNAGRSGTNISSKCPKEFAESLWGASNAGGGGEKKTETRLKATG